MTKHTTGGFALESVCLESPPVHIPNFTGGAYRTELVLERIPSERTVKIMWWHERDPRHEPHNHPWDFVSEILHGGYDEVRYWLCPDGSIQQETKSYREGDKNILPREVFHVVAHVLPKTVTRLTCGPAAPENEWGYLRPDFKDYVRAKPEPEFIADLRKLNPHLRSPK